MQCGTQFSNLALKENLRNHDRSVFIGRQLTSSMTALKRRCLKDMDDVTRWVALAMLVLRLPCTLNRGPAQPEVHVLPAGGQPFGTPCEFHMRSRNTTTHAETLFPCSSGVGYSA